jgi:hypothetical protein
MAPLAAVEGLNVKRSTLKRFTEFGWNRVEIGSLAPKWVGDFYWVTAD